MGARCGHSGAPDRRLGGIRATTPRNRGKYPGSGSFPFGRPRVRGHGRNTPLPGLPVEEGVRLSRDVSPEGASRHLADEGWQDLEHPRWGMPRRISFTTRPCLAEPCAFTVVASGERVRSRWTATSYCEKDRKQGLERKLCSFRGLSLSRIFAQVLLSGALVGVSIPGGSQITSPENSAKPRKPTSSPGSADSKS